MYLIYYALLALYMAISYELTGLTSPTLSTISLSFFLFFLTLGLFYGGMKHLKAKLYTILGIFLFLSFANLLKVRFQLSEITFFDFKLLGNAYSIAYLFLDKLPFPMLGFLTLSFIFVIYYSNRFLNRLRPEMIPQLKYPFLVNLVAFILLFFTLQIAQAHAPNSSYYNFLNSGKSLIETSINLRDTTKQLKATLSRSSYAKVDQTDNLLQGYPFNRPKDMDVVIIQSETFFDIMKYQEHLGENGIHIDENVNKNFQAFQNEGISGKFYVPTVGGGTVNTEYEVLTGYSAKAFAKGAIVFTSVLKEPTDSLATFMKKRIPNTETIGIHNHTRTYWDRDRVYPLLGIDTYIDMLQFTKAEQEDLVGAWMSDTTLFNKTKEVLEKNSGKNIFLLSVTSQNHGPFLDKRGEKPPITGLDPSEEWEISNFITNLRFSDQALKDFMTYINSRQKPTMVIFYGDHKPDPKYPIFENSAFYHQKERREIYSTDYFIYFNPAITDPKLVNLKGQKKDLSAAAMNRYLEILLGDTDPLSLYIYNYAKVPDNYFGNGKAKINEVKDYTNLSKEFVNHKIN